MGKGRRIMGNEATEPPRVKHRDPYGTKVGLQAAILAVFLSIFTILSHRTHIETIVKQNNSNDQWSHYQGKRIRDYQLEMNMDLLKVLGSNNPESKTLLADYEKKHLTYSEELEQIRNEAQKAATETRTFQHRALYFDFSEGVLEISLVLSSLYFISHRKLFPRLALVFAIFGIIAGICGLLF